MSWRTVVVSHSAKLEYKLGQMIVRRDNIIKINIEEIHTLIIESTAVSLTAALLNELSKKKVKVIFCDEQRNPSSELMSYYGSHDTSTKIKSQINWNESTKELVGREIISEKIRNQRDLLRELDKPEWKMLDSYVNNIEQWDKSNREGHAAKVYFNAIFGMEFTRTSVVPTNAALNYGYGILLAMFNREITANGYITQLGLFHDNMFNKFNLSSDLMEPFRIVIDRGVYELKPKKFETEEKHVLLEFINSKVRIDDSMQTVANAVKIYCKSVFDSLNDQDVSKIKFYKYEL